MNRLFLFILIFSSSLVHAGGIEQLIQAQCVQALDRLQSVSHHTLWQRALHADNELQNIAIKREDIVSIKENLQKDITSGFDSLGVYRVQTRRGNAVLKIYNEEAIHLDDVKVGMITQQYLGELGIAPQIWGFMPTSEVEKLIQQDPYFANPPADIRSSVIPGYTSDLRRSGAKGFAVLMEEIPDAWVLGSAQEPKNLNLWSVDAIEQQLKKIESVLQKLRVLPWDAQVLISPAGRVYLFDMDKYTMVSRFKKKAIGFKIHFDGKSEDALFADSLANYFRKYQDTVLGVRQAEAARKLFTLQQTLTLQPASKH